jgi:hypothetical protein
MGDKIRKMSTDADKSMDDYLKGVSTSTKNYLRAKVDNLLGPIVAEQLKRIAERAEPDRQCATTQHTQADGLATTGTNLQGADFCGRGVLCCSQNGKTHTRGRLRRRAQQVKNAGKI